MGRVVFAKKVDAALDWSRIESRLQDLSTPSPSSALPIEPSARLANDPPALNRSPVTAPGDPFDMLSLLTGIPSNRSRISFASIRLQGSVMANREEIASIRRFQISR